MKLALGSVVALCAVSAVLCYRAPQRVPSGQYSLPSIGGYPSPTVFNPRNHGLPDAYKNVRFRRSVDEQAASEYEQFAEEPALEQVLRQARSLDEFNVVDDEQAELSRKRRSPYQIILPTYRPPRRGPPKIYRV